MIKRRSPTEHKLINCLRRQNTDQTKRYIQKRQQTFSLKLNNLKNKEKLRSRNIKMAPRALENKSNNKKGKFNLVKDVWQF